MIFPFLLSSKKKAFRKESAALYDIVVHAARNPVFYQQASVPDTLDGRFEMLALHTFLLIDRLQSMDPSDGQSRAQALFDVFFTDMDRSARERGVGDLSVLKQMKRMMTGFNGRAHAYAHDNLREAVRRNVYGTITEIDAGAVSRMAAYISAAKAHLATQVWGYDHPPVSLFPVPSDYFNT